MSPLLINELAEALSVARAAIARVREIHAPVDALNVASGRRQQVCAGCGTDSGNWQPWPCPTTRALPEKTAQPTLFDVAATRITLSRKRGWKLPEGAISCARPHRYGNPFVVGTAENGGNITRDQAVEMFRRALSEGRLQFTVAEVKRELRGKSLACWCALDEACHVDVLLEVANG